MHKKYHNAGGVSTVLGTVAKKITALIFTVKKARGKRAHQSSFIEILTSV